MAQKEINDDRIVYCGGCGDAILASAAHSHDGVPYCDGCEEAPTEAEQEAAKKVRQFVRSYQDDDDIPEEDLERVFALAYGRPADDQDRAEGLWSHICASVRWA